MPEDERLVFVMCADSSRATEAIRDLCQALQHWQDALAEENPHDDGRERSGTGR